jgi:hypothetical protein
MTARELYEFALIEVNKLHSPSLLLEDYNYFINKAVQQYINLVYNKFDINQQSNDDLRALTATYTEEGVVNNKILLPDDYVHLLSCIVTINAYENKSTCGSCPRSYTSAAKRLTSDTYAGILNNYYLKPAPKRPYYILRSVPDYSHSLAEQSKPEVLEDFYNVKANTIGSELEIKCGRGEVQAISIDYVRAPRPIELTFEQLYSDIDDSQILEFPDYVCFEIVNLFTKLLMENASDPRLQTNLAVNQTIAGPSASTT